ASGIPEESLSERVRIVVGKTPDRDPPRCGPLDAPACDGIELCVHIDDAIRAQLLKEVPEDMQRRWAQRGALAAHEGGQRPRDHRSELRSALGTRLVVGTGSGRAAGRPAGWAAGSAPAR